MIPPNNGIDRSADGVLCGLDEVGRGALAGPLVAAAVILPADFDFAARFPGLRFGDSKKLTLHQREATYEAILESALDWRVERIEVPQIDELGLGWANKAIFVRLIESLAADRYIVDGNLKLPLAPEYAARVHSVVRADQSESAVSAASIVAKVTRDRLMRTLHEAYPDYDWLHNVGYGTAPHRAALFDKGRSPYHRRMFVDTVLRKMQAVELRLHESDNQQAS